MTEYVAGLLYDPKKTVVALIRKSHPEFMVGKLNAIGGKIKENESPFAAMVREFREETGVTFTDWKLFCVLGQQEHWNIWGRQEHWGVCFFYGVSSIVAQVQTAEEEEVKLYELAQLCDRKDLMTNLSWLIPMSLSMDREKASGFVIEEQHDS